MASKRRWAYEELREGIESRGGSMVFERSGWPRGGVWIVRLGDREKPFESSGSGFPELDRLYVPKVQNPMHHSDYSRELVPGALDGLVGMLG